MYNLCLDSQENLFGYKIAKLYHQIGENQIAKQYIVSYLSGKEDCAPGHFLAGQIAEALGENEAAVTSFERSYSIDRSQQHLVSLTCSLSKRDLQQCWSKRAETLSTQGIATNWCVLWSFDWHYFFLTAEVGLVSAKEATSSEQKATELKLPLSFCSTRGHEGDDYAEESSMKPDGADSKSIISSPNIVTETETPSFAKMACAPESWLSFSSLATSATTISRSGFNKPTAFSFPGTGTFVFGVSAVITRFSKTLHKLFFKLFFTARWSSIATRREIQTSGWWQWRSSWK